MGWTHWTMNSRPCPPQAECEPGHLYRRVVRFFPSLADTHWRGRCPPPSFSGFSDFPRRYRSRTTAPGGRYAVRGRALSLCGTCRCFSSTWDKDDPPGRPRPPVLKAKLMPDQVSPGASWTARDLLRGHWPVRSWCASAHFRIPVIVRGGKSRLLAPRCWASSLMSEEPPGRPLHPPTNALLIPDQVSPTTSVTGPE